MTGEINSKKTRGTTRQKILFILLLIFIIAGLVVIHYFKPGECGFYPPCLFHLATGLYCFGCGSGRAVHALTNGDVIKALDLNPLAVIFLPYLFYEFISFGISAFFGRRLPVVYPPAWALWGLLGVIILFGVARNIPVYPLSVLAP